MAQIISVYFKMNLLNHVSKEHFIESKYSKYSKDSKHSKSKATEMKDIKCR